MSNHDSKSPVPGRLNRKSRLARILENRDLYLFCLPGIIITLIFHYWPLYGAQIAFRAYSARRGIWGSPWVGWDHFIRFFNSPNAALIIWNTFVLSIYGLAAGFPIPIILALLLNSFHRKRYTKVIQTVTYAPNFISVVVMCSMIILFLSPRVGMVNKFIELLGGTTVNFMGERGMWRHIYVWTGVWQTMGWSSVVYFAALSGVNPEYHEAAIVDGATKLQRIIHIDLPTILPVAVMLLILSFGSLLSIGFEKVYALQNPLNLSVSEIISTYVYKLGILNNDMAYSSAIGLFNSAVNAVLLITVNTISRKLSDNALW
ncbi:MAG: ABC transporter permease subunit [Treponema sp.]|jgi:putative aldouronate transport system permease protein|nr:ABC transporter permease subunit [Treponema sp.]